MNYYEEVLMDATQSAVSAYNNTNVEDDSMGGAYIILDNFRSHFVSYMKQYHPTEISKNIGRGYSISLRKLPVSENKSYVRSIAGAEAFAEVLRGAGVDCYVRRSLG